MSRKTKTEPAAVQIEAAAPLEAVQIESTKPANRITIAPGEVHQAKLTKGVRIDMGNVPKPAITFIEPKASASPRGFQMPAAIYDADGVQQNYHEEAAALTRYILDRGTFPATISEGMIGNAYRFARRTPPRVYLDAFKLPNTSTWGDVLERIEGLAKHRLTPSRIVDLLALPVEDATGKPVTWQQALAFAGVQIKAHGDQLGPVIER